jgi:ABC-2 type transport system permease protein
MNRILVDLIASGRQYMRSKVGAFFTFFFPILLVLLFGAIFTATQSGKIAIPVQSLDQSVVLGPNMTFAFGSDLMDALNSTDLVSIEVIPAGVDLKEYMKEHSSSVALYIPANFTANVLSPHNATTPNNAILTLYGDPTQSTFGTANTIVSAVSDGMNYRIIQAQPIVVLGPPVTIAETFTYMDFFIPGVVGLTVMTNSLFSMTSICATYRDRNYFKLLATTKLKRYEWLLSHFLLYTILMITSLVVTFLVGKAVFDMSATLTPMAFLLIPAGAFLFISMGMLFGSAVKDPESAVAIANIIGFPMMFLSGSFFQIESFPPYLQAVARVMPLTYLNDGLRDTMVNQYTTGALINLAVLVVVGIVFAVLASRLMSWKEK